MRTPGKVKVIEPEVLEDDSVYPLHIVGGSRDLVICSFGDPNNDKMAESATLICSKKDNAYFMALAWNCHDELVAALGALRCFAIPGMNWTDEVGQELLALADEALAKAKEAL